MNSTFLKELYEKTEGYQMIEDSFLRLDTPTKALLEKDSIKEEILSAMDSINLTRDYYLPVAKNIAFYLLQIMEPKDLREELSKDLPQVRKEVVDALVHKILEIIVGKEISELIQKNWEEDDAEAEEVAEEMEISKVPPPPGNESKPASIAEQTPIKTIPLEPKEEKVLETKAVPTWEEKLASAQTTVPAVESRAQTDRTLPKLGTKNSDPYREMPE